MQIFISRNNERHGPYTLEQIQTYLDSGQMQGSDPAWYEGINGWTTLAQVPGIRVPQSTAPPPPYQPAPVQQPAKKTSPVVKGCGGCLGVIVLLAIIGAIVSPKPDNSGETASVSPPTSQSAPVEEGANVQEEPAAEEAISVSAQELDAEYEKNQVAADEKYNDKKVLVTGTVNDIGKDMMGDSTVTLSGSNPFGITCVFEKSEQAKLAQVSKGDTVTVRGICKGKSLNITIAYATLE